MEQELKTINIKAPETLEASLESITGPLEISLSSTVIGGKVTMPLPTIMQTQGLPEKDAMLFISECAEGKRKIAKAVKQKYETITEEESGVTEYSTFEELSNKISQIPIEVPLGSAMEQNGGVLPFYDVYNELVKASKTYTEYPYCCAMELDKWDYDNEHKVTLSGADAYLTSDGVYLRSSEVNGEYQFTDQDKPNSNRFVVYFFGSSPYQVPKSLPVTSVFGLWCLKGTPLMNFSSDFIAINSVNVYEGDLDVKEVNDFKFYAISLCQKLRLPHIKSISGGSNMIANNTNLREISLPNLTTISGGASIFAYNSELIEVILPNLTTISGGSNIIYYNIKLKEITLPNLTTIEGSSAVFSSCTNLQKINLPNLKNIKNTALLGGTNPIEELYLPRLYYFYASSTAYVIANTSLKRLKFPSLHTARGLLGNSSIVEEINLGDAKGADIQYVSLVANNKTLKKVTIENGFQGNLHLAYCTALTTDSVHAIIDNLAPCDTKGQYTITLSNSVTINEEYENKLVNEKLYNLARLG